MGKITGLIIKPSKTFNCPKCDKEYKTEDGLNKHIEKEHIVESQEKPKKSQ